MEKYFLEFIDFELLKFKSRVKICCNRFLFVGIGYFLFILFIQVKGTMEGMVR